MICGVSFEFILDELSWHSGSSLASDSKKRTLAHAAAIQWNAFQHVVCNEFISRFIT